MATKDLPIPKITKIVFSGNHFTKYDALLAIAKPLTDCQTVGTLDIASNKVKETLSQTGLFEHVAVIVDYNEKTSESTAIIHVEEAKTLSLSFGIETNEHAVATGSFTAEKKNFSGRLDSLAGKIHRELLGEAFDLTYNYPIYSGFKRSDISVSGCRSHESHVYSGCWEKKNAFSVKYIQGSHKFNYSLDLRETLPYPKSPFQILKEGGRSIKSSFKHEWVYDKRDSIILPTRGFALKLQHELAGIGGNVKFLKQIVGCQFNVPLWHEASISTVLKAGMLWGRRSQIHLCDRFFLGGATSLRGFGHNMVGPLIQNHNFGGELFASGHIGLTTLLPNPIPPSIRLHIFANAGNAVLRAGPVESVQDLWKTMRASVGAGLVFLTPIGQIQMNACFPVCKQADDKIHKFQLGIALDVI